MNKIETIKLNTLTNKNIIRERQAMYHRLDSIISYVNLMDDGNGLSGGHYGNKECI